MVNLHLKKYLNVHILKRKISGKVKYTYERFKYFENKVSHGHSQNMSKKE